MPKRVYAVCARWDIPDRHGRRAIHDLGWTAYKRLHALEMVRAVFRVVRPILVAGATRRRAATATRWAQGVHRQPVGRFFGVDPAPVRNRHGAGIQPHPAHRRAVMPPLAATCDARCGTRGHVPLPRNSDWLARKKTETKRLTRVLTVRHGTKHGIARSLRHS